MGKSFTRNDGLMIDSSVIAIDDNGTSLQDGINYKIYDSVADLDLTVGSATISEAVSAMPDRSILICNSTDFASGQRPTGNSNGTIEIIRYNIENARVVIRFSGWDGLEYRMYMTGSSSYYPTGTWVKLMAESHVQTYINGCITMQSFSQTVTKPAANATGTLTYSIAKSGWTPMGVVGYHLSGNISTYCNIANYYMSGTSAYLTYRNLSTSAASENWTIVIYVLYRRAY